MFVSFDDCNITFQFQTLLLQSQITDQQIHSSHAKVLSTHFFRQVFFVCYTISFYNLPDRKHFQWTHKYTYAATSMMIVLNRVFAWLNIFHKRHFGQINRIQGKKNAMSKFIIASLLSFVMLSLGNSISRKKK